MKIIDAAKSFKVTPEEFVSFLRRFPVFDKHTDGEEISEEGFTLIILMGSQGFIDDVDRMKKARNTILSPLGVAINTINK